MAIQADRERLKKQYPGRAWAKKVDKMRDDQVAAILLGLKAKNKLK